MRTRADEYRQKAADCELAAHEAHDRLVKAQYRELARQWLDLARELAALKAERQEHE
jgi:hypothetical protein